MSATHKLRCTKLNSDHKLDCEDHLFSKLQLQK